MSKKKHREYLSEQINEAHQQITKGPQPKLPISIYDRYGISENLMHQSRQWHKSIWTKEK